MPAAAKTPFSTKNPATLAKTVGAGAFSGSSGVQQGGEVVCPLFNSDGSQCRKKCVGNFAYRSICEHIRRAHPDNWIPKLPASPETFAKMVGLNPNGRNGALQLHNHNVVRKPNMSGSVRKPTKLSKIETEHYLDGLSPPSSANDSDALPSLASLHSQAPYQNFQTRFPPANHYGGVMYDREEDDEEMDGDHEVDEDIIRQHTETETEDEDYSNVHLQYNPYFPSVQQQQQRPRNQKPKVQKRKRQSTFDSTSSTSSFGGSRWNELIEAATHRAIVESSPMPTPLSPPQTANTLPSICPNTPTGSSASSTAGDPLSPQIQCAECSSCAPIKQSYICTECASGFCEECALNAGKRGMCSECRVFNAKFKPLKIVIRA